MAKAYKPFNNYSRSVSVIGVGCTPFVQMLENPEYAGLTEGELFGYAALEACEDAGIRPDDIEFCCHGAAMPTDASNYITPAVQVKNWFGQPNVASINHSEACCTGYVALEEGAMAVASGEYDVVLTGCVEMGASLPAEGRLATERVEWPFADSTHMTAKLNDRAYARPIVGGGVAATELTLHRYSLDYGCTDDEIDDYLVACAYTNREHAKLNELALRRESFDDIAKRFGMDNGIEYLKSKADPKLGRYLRMSGMVERAEGAAAAILVPTDMVREYPKAKPIEIKGIGHTVVDYTVPYNEVVGTELAAQQVYESTGIDPEEIGLLLTNDFFISSSLTSPEAVGYIPKGKCGEYLMDGRTRFDGDKPMNTNGGRTSFGHAHAASGLADLYEAVKQLRGEAGDHQITNGAHLAMLRGFGGGQNFTAGIVGTLD